MKTKLIASIAAASFLPVLAWAQPSPPSAPPPPGAPGAPQGAQPPPPPPPPPGHGDRGEKMPKVPVTYLGVDTSPVPPVVCEQLGLPKGFGLVVDYVAPDGPAAAAGVQQNDILKMINDQILMEPMQLAKLVRSYSEGTTVTLTVLRKGQEQKITVKLAKKEMPQHREFGPHGMMDFALPDFDIGQFTGELERMKHELGEGREDIVRNTVMKTQEAMERVREQAQQQREAAQRMREEAQRVREEVQRHREQAHQISERAREEAQRAAEQIKMVHSDGNGVKTTRIDVGKAQIVFADDKGELRLENAGGKKMLTAKDPQGRLLFSGPVGTKEELDKVPADVRQRYENLAARDLPTVMAGNEDEDDNEMDADSDDNEPEQSEAPAESVTAMLWPLKFPVCLGFLAGQ